jgi:CRP-like cAMP-binding protein
MKDFVSSFNNLSNLSQEAAEDLNNCLSAKTFGKGERLLKSGEISKKLFFIEEGLVKIFFSNEQKEFIMRFFPEFTLFSVLNSFETQTPSQYEIMALEKTSVSYLLKTDLEILCKKHHCIETAHRKLLGIATINMMKRISEMLEENATERYNNFLRDNGVLLQRISLGDLANYLGITQVSLSRIRAGK